MRSAVVALACAVTVMLGLLALPATAARADSTAALPQLTSFHQMVVDSQAGYIFLSEGIGSELLGSGTVPGSSLVVTTLSGSYVATLDSGEGVEGLALSPDGSPDGTLYVALAGATHEVAAIDVSTVTAATPTETDYPLGSDAPYSLAFQSGDVWVSYYSGVFSSIGVIDPTSAPASAFNADGAPLDWQFPPDIAADPSDTGMLTAAEPAISTATAATFNTTTVPATAVAASANLGGSGTSSCSFETQIAVVPRGSQFIAACQTPQVADLYGTGQGDLDTPVSDYPNAGTADPADVAISGNGTVAVGYSGSENVDIYSPDGTLLTALTAPNTGFVADDGLAFSADGSQLFAVDQNFSGGYSLTVFDNPTLNRSALSLLGPGTAVAGTSITLTGSLTLGNGASPSGLTVAVTRTNPDGTSTTLTSVQTAADGSFTVTDSPTPPGNYTYTANYAGDTSTEPATATFQVTVALNKATISLSSPAVVTFGANVTVAGKMSLTTGAPPTGTKLTVVRTQAGSTATKTFSVSTGTSGSFTVTDSRPAIAKYTYTTTYAGIPNSTTTAKAALTVSVERTTPSLTIKTSAANVNYGKSITITATLGPTLADRWVGIYAGPAGQPKKLLKLAKVNAQGNLSVGYTLSRNTTFYAEFSGDSHNAPKTVSHGVGVYVLVYMSPSGYFKTVKISGTTYQVYHHTALLHTYSRIVPDKAGECIKLEFQQYINGWQPNRTYGCFALNKSSVFGAYFNLSQVAGTKWRIRTDYFRGRDGNNLNTDGGWVYFEVVN
jgi:hypothetical protein